MTSKIRRLLLLVFVLLAVACEPTPPQSPHSRGLTSRARLNDDARWLLGADGSGCSARLDDLQAGEPRLEIADSGQGTAGVPAQDNPNLMAVRKPILDELLAYPKSKDKTEKEKHAQSLRELFGSISTAAALPFAAMLETEDAVAVTFRKVLKDDPLKGELIGMLEKKAAPPPAQPPPQSPTPSAQPPASSVTLPVVNLTDEGSFDQFHKDIKERIDVLEGAVNGLSGPATAVCKTKFQHDTVPALRDVLRTAKEGSDKAFKESDASEKSKGLKDAAADHLGALYATQIALMAVNFVIVQDYAVAQGLPALLVDQPYRAYIRDEDILSLLQASLEGDASKMAAALSKGTARYQYHVQFLDQWIVSLNSGAALSKKVIQVANIAMIAVSIYQAWRIPVVAGGGAPSPPTISGALPGGVAVSSGVNVANLANSLEAIRRLVAIGALDGALVGGLAGLGGSPSATLPELQKPSLSVQNPGGSGGSGSSPPAAPAAQPADLQPYSKGAGHHVPAKRAFEGTPGYDPKNALAVPKDELARLKIEHTKITTAQQSAYVRFAKEGKPLTWEAIAKLETDALVDGGMKPDMAQATVAKAIKALKDAGVAAPVRIPWGR